MQILLQEPSRLFQVAMVFDIHPGFRESDPGLAGRQLSGLLEQLIAFAEPSAFGDVSRQIHDAAGFGGRSSMARRRCASAAA